MSMTWHSDAPPPQARRAPGHGARLLWRGGRIALVIGAGVMATLLLRLIERPLHGLQRPWTQGVTVWVCGRVLAILGLALVLEGRPMAGPGAVVANHVSWLDIFVLNARKRVYFVSKAEVAAWPGIGWLARATGTVFIRRARADTKAQQQLFHDRIRAGHHLLFFPEGTSTDGLRVLPFKPTLFQPFHDHGLERVMQIQPVSVIYHAPKGEDPRFYGWWGDMAFGPHLLRVLAAPRQGAVEIVFHDPVRVQDFASRKALAAWCEACVRSAIDESLGTDRVS